MPEARDRRSSGDLGLGFGIRRGPRNCHERNMFRSDDKENIPPEGSRSIRRRKGPLPSWYPRTPLRDITSIVKALERRRAHLRGAAELRRRNQEIEISPPPPSITSPPTHEPSISEQITVTESPFSDISDCSANPVDSIKSFSEPAENPIESPSSSNVVGVPDLNITPDEKKLLNFDDIELVVRVNSQSGMAQMPAKKKSERSALMSMR
ncbi:protein GIGAS CELL1-like [Tasmannia lanceolata]|uniref:protein GIGAS CELL1-like n=1 Tax=Tasmannia lanceolata TaxID=3420 RepID=UPI0040628A28